MNWMISPLRPCLSVYSTQALNSESQCNYIHEWVKKMIHPTQIVSVIMLFVFVSYKRDCIIINIVDIYLYYYLLYIILHIFNKILKLFIIEELKYIDISLNNSIHVALVLSQQHMNTLIVNATVYKHNALHWRISIVWWFRLFLVLEFSIVVDDKVMSYSKSNHALFSTYIFHISLRDAQHSECKTRALSGLNIWICNKMLKYTILLSYFMCIHHNMLCYAMYICFTYIKIISNKIIFNYTMQQFK